MSRGGYFLLEGKVGNKGVYFVGAHIARLAFDIRRAQSRVVKENILARPGSVGVFSTQRVMFDT